MGWRVTEELGEPAVLDYRVRFTVVGASLLSAAASLPLHLLPILVLALSQGGAYVYGQRWMGCQRVHGGPVVLGASASELRRAADFSCRSSSSRSGNGRINAAFKPP